jgi:hypothetical protein
MRKVVALLVALVVSSGVAVAVTATQAGASSESTVVGHITNTVFVTGKGASLSPSGPLIPGDRLVNRASLSQNGAVVGFSEVVCTVTFNDDLLCDGIDALTNRGDLHVSGLLRGAVGPSGIPKVFDLIVDGGTFTFHNAHGSAHVVVLPNGDEMTTTVLG